MGSWGGRTFGGTCVRGDLPQEVGEQFVLRRVEMVVLESVRRVLALGLVRQQRRPTARGAAEAVGRCDERCGVIRDVGHDTAVDVQLYGEYMGT